MQAGISPENETFLNEAVAAGMFDSRDDAVNEAITRLRSHHQLKNEINCRRDEMQQGQRIDLETDQALDAFFDEMCNSWQAKSGEGLAAN